MIPRDPRSRCLLTILLLTAGCGMDQDDMRKYALRRPSDEELENAGPRPTPTSPTLPSTAAPAPSAAVVGETVATPGPTAIAPGPPPTSNAASAAGDPPPGAVGTVSDTRSPDPSLTLTARRQMTIDNMTRIVQGLEAYLAAHGSYPPSAVHSPSGQPLYSWRVAILPYLGYQALHDQFHHNEPWNSPHNQACAARIPAVYQSPERFDTNTNYQVPVGNTAAFFGPRGNPPRRWEDGLENVAILLEVDDTAAVPWTAPRDWQFDSANPKRSLGNLRQDGIFVGWGGGSVAMIPQETPDGDLRAMFTVDGGESFYASAVCRAALAEPASPASGVASPPIPRGAGPDRLATANRTRGAEIVRAAPTGIPAGGNDVTEWTELARQAFAAGLEAEGARLAMAAFLADEPTAAVRYEWIPGLRRPATVVRLGVGLDYRGLQSVSVRRQLGNPDQSSGPPMNKWVSIVGDLAEPILDRLQTMPRTVPAVADVAAGPSAPPAANVPLMMLGVADARTLIRAALIHDIDVVLVFDVEEKTTRSGKTSKSVELSVWDTWSGRELWKSSRVNYLRRKHAQNDPLYRDPVDRAADQFASFLDEAFHGRPLPAEIQPAHAARRLESLARLRRDNRLPVLSEMKFYRQMELVSVQELMAGYQAVLGASAGAELLAGTLEEKRQAIADWIPEVDLQLVDVRRRSAIQDRDD